MLPPRAAWTDEHAEDATYDAQAVYGAPGAGYQPGAGDPDGDEYYQPEAAASLLDESRSAAAVLAAHTTGAAVRYNERYLQHEDDLGGPPPELEISALTIGGARSGTEVRWPGAASQLRCSPVCARRP